MVNNFEFKQEGLAFIRQLCWAVGQSFHLLDEKNFLMCFCVGGSVLESLGGRGSDLCLNSPHRNSGYILVSNDPQHLM